MVFVVNGSCGGPRADGFEFILFVNPVGDMNIYVEDSEDDGMDCDCVMSDYNDPLYRLCA